MATSFPVKKEYSPGGYRTFMCIPYRLISAYPMISQGKCVVPLSIVPGAQWLHGYATSETLSYDEEPQSDEQGTYYNITLAGFVPGQSPELIDLIEQLPYDRYILLVSDRAGYLRLVGTPVNPLNFMATFSSGTNRTDAKGFNFKFTGRSLYRSPVYMP